MAVPFDTHVFITEMIQAGMPDTQAEALSHQLQDIYSTHAVTKSEFDLAMAKLDTRFATMEGQLTHLRYLGYAIFAATVVKFFVN